MSHNDITGDRIASRVTNAAYAANYDAIFGKKSFPKAPDGDAERAKQADTQIYRLGKLAQDMGISNLKTFPGTDPNVTAEQKAKDIADALQDLSEGKFTRVDDVDYCDACHGSGKVTDTAGNEWDCYNKCPAPEVPNFVILNGETLKTNNKVLGYHEIVALAGRDPRFNYTVTALVRGQAGQAGQTVLRGEVVPVVSGMIINVSFTGNA